MFLDISPKKIIIDQEVITFRKTHQVLLCDYDILLIDTRGQTLCVKQDDLNHACSSNQNFVFAIYKDGTIKVINVSGDNRQ